MKRLLFLLACGLMAGSLAAAQDMPSSSTTTSTSTETNSQDRGSQTTSQSTRSQNTVVRGCLRGSTGNYTVTDQNGMMYKVMGDDSTLQGKVGHEVEISGMESQSSEMSSQEGESTSHAANSLQASDVRDLASSCKMGGSATTPPVSDSDSGNTKGTPDTSAPVKPQLMAMLQEQSSPAMSGQTQNGNQTQQTTPPVTSQTPSTSNSPTSTNPQSGSPADDTGMTPDQANRNAQSARQGELNTNPKTGETTGRGVDNQGVNNPSQTPSNAVPDSRNSTTSNPQATPQSNPPQANANDPNKPLYERQATDIPWANHGGTNNSGATTTPAPQ